MKKSAYERLVRPLLFSLDPETAHHFAISCLRLFPGLIPKISAQHPTSVFGLNFPNPVGLAAGFDKNGVALPAWEALGFGFVEIGTVTALPQPGNPKPRIFRYPEQEALINRLGFNNDGAEAVAQRLRRLRARGRWPHIPVGINIGKSKATPLENAPEDYLQSFRLLHDFADYIVLNVSSPNTPGLRELQAEEALVRLLQTITQEKRATPVLLKIAPDISDADLDHIIAACEAHGIAGLIATNTTLDHGTIPKMQDQTGGLSGAPLQEKSTALVRAITARSKLPVIGVGGIFDAASARAKFQAGAKLIQLYTGYIYRGPALIPEIVRAL
ncbi:MAG: quinone-dependent dihydroorotate dehydrogenase [Chthoniobacterales bacterium]